MKETYLKPWMECVIFTIYDLFTMNVIWWEWQKNPEIQINEKVKPRKKIHVWLPSHPPVYEMEADCFPVSDNTENKPDLP